MNLLEGIISKVDSVFNKKNAKRLDTDSSTEIRGFMSKELVKKLIRDRNAQDYSDTDNSMYSSYSNMLKSPESRQKLYSELEKMDLKDGLISMILDIYADNASQGEDDDIVKFVSQNRNIQKPLDKMKKGLSLNEEHTSICRTTAHYGNCFEEIVLDSESNFCRLKNLDPKSVERKEDRFGRLLDKGAFVQQTLDGKVDFRSWEVVHFRNKKYRNYKYGIPFLISIMDDYKRYVMMKDALVIHRLSRAPLRYVYYVDTEGLNIDDRLEYLKLVKQMTKRRRTTDPVTGKMNLNYNPLSVEEDIHLAVTKDSKSDVKVLQGYGQVYMQDILFIIDCILCGAKIPKNNTPFGNSTGKSTMTELDVQFARCVRTLQYAVQVGYRQLGDFSLLLAGMNTDNIENNTKNGYKIILPALSTIDELRLWQIEQIKAQIGQTVKATTNIPNEWIYGELMGMNDEQIARVKTLDEEAYAKEQERYVKSFETEMELQSKQNATSPTSSNAEVRLSNKGKKSAVEPPSIEGIVSGGRLMDLKRLTKKNVANMEMLNNWKLGEEVSDKELIKV